MKNDDCNVLSRKKDRQFLPLTLYFNAVIPKSLTRQKFILSLQDLNLTEIELLLLLEITALTLSFQRCIHSEKFDAAKIDLITARFYPY